MTRFKDIIYVGAIYISFLQYAVGSDSFLLFLTYLVWLCSSSIDSRYSFAICLSESSQNTCPLNQGNSSSFR